MKKNSRLVYSTETGKIKPPADTKPSVPASTDGILRVGRETKGRKGKGVTLIKGFDLPEAELKILGKNLKQHCGTGGTVKAGQIEIQGDHRDAVLDYLEKNGFKAKKSGG